MKSVTEIRNLQRGAVSLFVVIFATLLISVVTVGFLRLMINDQNQAASNDLSQSAYDSALAGVEDAKRALLRYQKICNEDGETVCNQLATQIAGAACNDALRIGDVITDPDGGEVLVQQTSSAGDTTLDQAYTCVDISLRTPNFIGTAALNESKLIPLVGKSDDGNTTFDTVRVEWFSSEDLGTSSSGTNPVDLTGPASPQPLPQQSSWPSNRPPILRTQLMQFGDNFQLNSFDATSGSTSNANTVFMYPTSDNAATDSHSFVARDTRKPNLTSDPPADSAGNSPLPIKCVASLATGGYACTAELSLPAVIGGGDRTAYLRLTPFYNATHFRVTLLRAGAVVQFDGVQPEIDSTGRANDLFRRVVSRVDLVDTSFPYPEAAVDISGNFCKDFAVTDSQYIAGACTP